MAETKFQDEIARLINAQKQWQKEGVQISADELLKVNSALEQLSFFSRQTNSSECERIINNLQKLIQTLSVEVKSEEKELQAETHGGQSFTEDELERINEYAYRRELAQCLQHALEMVYETRPEFKPRTS